MTNQETNMAVAECCGLLEPKSDAVVVYRRVDTITSCFQRVRQSNGGESPCYRDYPDFCNDRNTTPQMLAALKDPVEQITFLSKLIDRKLMFNDFTYDTLWAVLSADQQKVAKAFLVAKGKLEVK